MRIVRVSRLQGRPDITSAIGAVHISFVWDYGGRLLASDGEAKAYLWPSAVLAPPPDAGLCSY